MPDEYIKDLCDERHAMIGRQRLEDRDWIREQFESTREEIREIKTLLGSSTNAWRKLIPWLIAALLAGGGGGTMLKALATDAPDIQVSSQK